MTFICKEKLISTRNVKTYSELKGLQGGKIYHLSWYLFWHFTTFICQTMLSSASHLGENVCVSSHDCRNWFVQRFSHSKECQVVWVREQTALIYANWARWIWERDKEIPRPSCCPSISSSWFKCVLLYNTKPLNTSLLLCLMLKWTYGNCSNSKEEMGYVQWLVRPFPWWSLPKGFEI